MDPVSAEGAEKLFVEAVKTAVAVLKGPAKEASVAALAALKGYSSYLTETNRRVSTYKSFADPSKPVSLLDNYVSMSFQPASNRHPTIDQDELIDRLVRQNLCAVVSATAEFGKSMVQRYIALSLYENPRGKIPLFIELRHIKSRNLAQSSRIH